MPLYYFHIRRQDGFDADTDGTTFDTPDAAVSEATSSLREIVAEELRSARPSDIVSLEITDTAGKVIATVTVEDAVLKPLRHTTTEL